MNRRNFLLAGVATIAFASSPARALQAAVARLTPEQFGARGDGRSDDSDAFARLAAEVNRRGAAEIVLRPVTYLVGRQPALAAPRHGFAFYPVAVLELEGLVGPLIIRGNGARLRCRDGLRYGTFDLRTGRRTVHPMPYLQTGEMASPYRWMIRIGRCAGPVDVSDLELDGNLPRLLVGGPWGDTGHQLPATGIGLYDNRGEVRLSRLRLHHHGLDGLIIDHGPGSGAVRLVAVRAEHNGRQGCSIVGGRGLTFQDCHFSHTGKGGLASNPGAGVDIEAEGGKTVSGLTFTRCTFADNAGPGLVADSGPSENATFDRCTFIGATNWAAWPNKPGFRFRNSTFVGPIVRCFGDAARPDRATRFEDCRFLDDPALSPTGQVYGGENPDRPIADLPHNPNVRFVRCRFDLTHRAVLPWTTNAVIFEDCTLRQRSRVGAYPRGTFVGRNRIDAPAVGLSSAVVRGELLLNGRALPRGPIP